MIPSSFIQDLLTRTDIADLVGRHVTLKKAGINYKGLCPFHGEKSPSFVVSPSRQTYHCFGCGVHGNAIGFLMEHSGLNFIEAVRDLAQIQGMPVPEEQASPQAQAQARQQKEKQVSLTEVLARAAQHWRVQLRESPRAVTYLKGRGLTGEIAARFGLGYAPEGWKGLASAFPSYDDPLLVESGLVIVPEDTEASPDAPTRRYDRFRDRIMFPIRSVQGEVIGFGGRVLDKGEPKYLNSPETPVFSKGRELYGLYEARSALRNKGYVIVTEGYMDVVALAQWGYGNAVATLGTACTADHVSKLFRFTDQVVFSFDGDAAGRRAAGRALEAALPHATDTRRVSFLVLPTEHDPDSYIRAHGAEAFEACVQSAAPLSRQLLTHAAQDCDLESAEGRVKLLAQALPLMAQLPQGGLRGQIAQDLAALARSPLDAVQQQLNHHLAALAQGGRASHHAAPWAESDADTPWAQGAPRYRQDQADQPSPNNRRPWRPGQKGQRWSGNSGGWERQGRPARPLPQAARPLERAAWMLLHRSDLWEQLNPDMQELLCDQPMPLGAFFCWLDRLVAQEGSLGASELGERLQGAGVATPLGSSPAAGDRAGLGEAPGVRDDGLAQLAQRLAHFHEVGMGEITVDELLGLIRPLQLQALNDELDLLLQSGELSEAADARKIALLHETRALKLEISRQHPISG